MVGESERTGMDITQAQAQRQELLLLLSHSNDPAILTLIRDLDNLIDLLVAHLPSSPEKGSSANDEDVPPSPLDPPTIKDVAFPESAALRVRVPTKHAAGIDVRSVEVAVPSDNILPTREREQGGGFAEEEDIEVDDSTSEDDLAPAGPIDQVQGEEVITFHYDDGEQIGAWEEHSKGIGSRLLAKMGYRLGDGLGKDATGRMRPVESEILPVGRGLGCEIERRVRKRKRAQPEVTKDKMPSTSIGRKRDVFAFMNMSLNNEPAAPQPNSISNRLKGEKRSLTPNVRLDIVQLQKRSDRLASELGSARQALARNVQDKKISDAYRLRISNLTAEKESLQREIGHLTVHVDTAKRNKDMMKF
ncbi:hypothetical protein HKX48_003574 [Thoreauomyces humboldtii]|nr:hypothetical protein HKX48_003574 [Thoreauomyces humboldtii]